MFLFVLFGSHKVHRIAEELITFTATPVISLGCAVLAVAYYSFILYLKDVFLSVADVFTGG